ncbi:MAG TPA: sigma-70 family RNA polymerase sigma factor [Nannocystaceae bacterium]|nr:sigma-70 family RNA polymerase sigma factor [Nannocystaceae bacterium]
MDDERTDVELLARWRDGDSQAATALVRRHFVAVYRFFSANVRDAESEDLTQRTFEACTAARDRIRDDASFRAYLFGIARNQLAMHLERTLPRGPAVPASQIHLADPRTTPTGVLARADERDAFGRAMQGLSPKLRRILELFYWEDKSVAEIARELGVSEGTVKSRLFRAREQVAAAIVALRLPDELERSTLDALRDDPG